MPKDRAVFELPMRVASVANLREHWAVKAKRVKKERTAVFAVLRTVRSLPALPVNVKMVRLAPRTLDGDNLQSAFKAVRDELAAAFKLDDNSVLIDWFYSQEKSKTYGVRIEIESQPISKNWKEGKSR